MATNLKAIRNRYPGGKNAAGHAAWILSHFAPHWKYAELFAGSAALLRRKVPAFESVVCDVSADICEYWRGVQWPGVSVVHGCGLDWLASLLAIDGDLADWLLYADPPYPLATRTAGKIYAHEMTLAQHRRFLRLANRIRCPIAISGYAHPLYDRMLAGWYSTSRQVQTRGGTRREFLWLNYDPDENPSLEKSRHATDTRERQNCDRQIKSWVGKFDRLPPWRRSAILAALVESERKAASKGF